MKKIKVSDLKIIAQKIIERIEFEESEEIDIHDDLYRLIPTGSWDTFESTVTHNGSLFDDVDELKKLASGENDLCTYVDFDRFASLLRYISEKYNPPG